MFSLLTLVDITATDVTRSTKPECLLRNQQRNYETVLQVLSLRTQPHVTWRPTASTIDSKKIKNIFGELYAIDSQKVWTMHFTAEHPTAYDTTSGSLQGLINDFEQVPIITGLTETANFMLPIFYPVGSIKNIHITKLSSC